MKKFILFITLVASAISVNAYDLSYNSSSYEYRELSNKIDKLNDKIDKAQREAEDRAFFKALRSNDPNAMTDYLLNY
ncbi:hypothetical protein [Campylobacter devanensis]|uniref:hypothetical protein n=1 Tax=Campylobacter devanensis TaxID=3161138 RepID=UPI000A33B11C|nr:MULTISPECIES: hypothetical protein [unclassified Campylobacter]